MQYFVIIRKNWKKAWQMTGAAALVAPVLTRALFLYKLAWNFRAWITMFPGPDWTKFHFSAVKFRQLFSVANCKKFYCSQFSLFVVHLYVSANALTYCYIWVLLSNVKWINIMRAILGSISTHFYSKTLKKAIYNMPWKWQVWIAVICKAYYV